MYLWRLECFRTLAEELNFTRAAERLHTSQPAISRQIQAFEKDVGTQLFTRSGGTVLTSAGAGILPDVVDILDRVEKLQSKIAIQKGSANLRLRVLYGRSIDAPVVQSIVTEYEKAFPQVEIESEIAWTSYNLELLLSNKADIAFVRLPLEKGKDGLNSLELGRESLKLAVHADSALAREKQISAHQLRHLPLIHWPRRQAPGSFDALMEIIFGDSPVRLSGTEPSTELRVRAVEANQGAAIITTNALDGYTTETKEIPIIDLEWAFGLAWKNTSKPHVYEFIRIAEGLGKTLGDES